ncbi:MAG: FHA domain-containing protein [Gammaproteobacteria bacterium]
MANGRALLNDYSRFGTLLNGRKVNESAVLQPGDVVSMGDPACDFRLVAETGPDGA